MSWTHDNPGAGDPGAIRNLAALRLTKSSEIQQAIRQLSTVEADANSSAWEGEAQHAFVTALATTYPDLNTLEAGLSAQGGALHRYADALDIIQAEQAQLTTLRRDAAAELYGLRYKRSVSDLDEPWSYRIDDAEAELASLQNRWTALIDARRAADHQAIAALTNEQALGKNWQLGKTTISGATDAEFLALLNKLSPTDLRALLKCNPDLEARLTAAKPEDVAPWWNGLDKSQQAAIIGAIPLVIGNLGGVAYASRDVANRLVLKRELKAVTKARAALAISASEHDSTSGIDPVLQAKFDALSAIYAGLGREDAVLPRQLISLDASVWPFPLAAISVGDLDTARYASYQVSGMFSSTRTMNNATNDAVRLWREEQDLIRVHGIEGSQAVVAWIGYSSPDLVTVRENEHAKNGAILLADDLRDYRATAAGAPDRYLTVNAHSYGSTTAALALAEPGVTVDAFAMYGSAGITNPVRQDDLHVAAEQTWVGEDSDDLLAPFGRFYSGRSDPGEWESVRRFDTAGGELDPVSGKQMTEVRGHDDYLDRNSESLRNLALINLGQTGSVTAD